MGAEKLEGTLPPTEVKLKAKRVRKPRPKKVKVVAPLVGIEAILREEDKKVIEAFKAAVAVQPEVPAEVQGPRPLFSLTFLKQHEMKPFGEMTAEKRAQVGAALNYIEMLGTTTGTNLEQMCIFTLFGKGTSNITTDAGEINKLFFEELAKPKPVPELELTPDLAAKLTEASRSIVDNKVATLKQNVESNQRNARDYYKSASTYAETSYKLQVELDALLKGREQANAELMIGQIKEIMKEGVWKFLSVHKSYVRFVSVNQMTSAHKTREGQEVVVNYGKFMVEVNLANMRLLTLPYENNFLSANMTHAHTRDGCSMCWGTASDAISRAMQKGSLPEMLRLTTALLLTPNTDGGYWQITDGVYKANLAGKVMSAAQIKQHQETYGYR